MVRILKYIILILLFASSAYGATYYVRTDGNDSTCDGTQNEAAGDGTCAWLTVAYAATQLSGTHTISVGDGIYTESQIVLPVDVSLTSTSQDPDSVTIQPAATLTKFNGLISYVDGSNTSQTLSYITVSGTNGAYEAFNCIYIENRDNVRITQNQIKDCRAGNWWSSAIAVTSTDNDTTWYADGPAWPSDPQEPGTDTNVDEYWPTDPVEGLEIDNNLISDSGYQPNDTINGTGAITIHNVKDGSIHHNTIDGSPYGLESITGGVTGVGQDGALDNFDIYNNTLTMGDLHTVDTFSIEIWMFKGGCQIYNNTTDGGFSVTYGKETKIYDNTFVSSEVQLGGTNSIGLEVNMQSYGLIEGNYFSGYDKSIHTGHSESYGSWNGEHLILRENVVYNTRRWAHWIHCYIPASGSSTVSNIYDYNNTYHKNRDSVDKSLIHISEVNAGGTCTLQNVFIKNNILFDSLGYAGKTTGTITGLVIDNNNFYNNNDGNSWLNTSPTGTTTDDPALENAGGEYDDYAPISGSAMINAGTYLTEVNDGDDCAGAGCTAMIVDDVGYFVIGDSVWVDAATDFLAEITAINYSTNTLTLDAANDHEDGNDIYLAYSSTQGLIGSSVDLGAIEYTMFISDPSPVDDAIDVATSVGLSVTLPTGTVTSDVYIKAGTGECTFTADNRVKDDQDISSVSNADLLTELGLTGALDTETAYCWRWDINHAGGTEEGIVYNFTTAEGPPIDPGPNDGMIFGGTIPIRITSGGIPVGISN